MKNVKSEKGAVTLLVLVTILFFVAFLITTYIFVANKAKSQIDVTDQTRQIYDSVNPEEAYNSYFGDKAVPIYTVAQLLEMGTGDSIQINEAGGKMYTFAPDATYVLMNDLEFDYANKGFDNTTGNIEDRWIPIGNRYDSGGVLESR